MSHKAHPKVLRIKKISDWMSQGFYGKRFPNLLKEDFSIRKFLLKKLEEAGIESVIIERSPGKIKAIIYSARPGLIIGRGGSGAEELKKEIIKKLFSDKKNSKAKTPEFRIEIQEVKNPWTSAQLIGQWIAKQIEKRMPFRKVLKQTLEKVMMNKEIKGARLNIAGRLDGAEISRREWLKKGRLPRQTLRSEIDYAEVQAYCTYGVIGIKVWLYKGDRFD